MTQDMKILEKSGHNTVEIQQLINYLIKDKCFSNNLFQGKYPKSSKADFDLKSPDFNKDRIKINLLMR